MLSGEKIKNLRKSRNISLKKLSDRCHIPYRTLQDWERGVRKPTVNLEYIEALLNVLDCNAEDICEEGTNKRILNLLNSLKN